MELTALTLLALAVFAAGWLNSSRFAGRKGCAKTGRA